MRVMSTPTPVTDATEVTPAAHSAAWIHPLLAVGLASSIAPALLHAGWKPAFAIAISVLLGTVGGAAWQLRHRRDFVDRFATFAMFFSFYMLLPLFAPDNIEFHGQEGTWALVGVLNGVVLAEQWLRWRRPA